MILMHVMMTGHDVIVVGQAGHGGGGVGGSGNVVAVNVVGCGSLRLQNFAKRIECCVCPNVKRVNKE